MENQKLIAELNSDLISKGLKFYNRFQMKLFEHKLEAKSSRHFGLKVKEKTFGISNIDSIEFKKGFDLLLLLVGMGLVLYFIHGLRFGNAYNDFPGRPGPSSRVPTFGVLSFLTGIVLVSLSFSRTKLVIKSNNDTMAIVIGQIKRDTLNGFIEKVLNQKRVTQSSGNQDIERNSEGSEDFKVKIEKLNSLLKDGLISEKEFSSKKAEILKKI